MAALRTVTFAAATTAFDGSDTTPFTVAPPSSDGANASVPEHKTARIIQTSFFDIPACFLSSDAATPTSRGLLVREPYVSEERILTRLGGLATGEKWVRNSPPQPRRG